MTRLLFPSQRYGCIQCGQSCGHWRIWVEPELVQSIRAHPLALELDVTEPAGAAGWHRLRYDKSGRCHFLRSDLLCALHADGGWKAKPRACRQFPFFLVETPDGFQVGLSFRCTAVRADQGVDWEEHRADLESLIDSGEYPRLGFEPVSFGNRRLDWSTYRTWEAAWLERGLPLAEAVYPELELQLDPVGWAQLLDQLAAAALGFLEGCPSDQIALAFYTGEPFPSQRRGMLPSLSLQPVHEPLLQRYLTHVLERKTLWNGQHWLGRLVLVLVAERLLAYYGRLDGWPAAVAQVEGEWLAHRDDLEPIERGFEQTLLPFLR